MKKSLYFDKGNIKAMEILSIYPSIIWSIATRQRILPFIENRFIREITESFMAL
ncbi:MAG: hypothetical protein MR687_05090 [Spirochaetales bacterium]|nr:hypothetical protein [Spirochaetales bacterium]